MTKLYIVGNGFDMHHGLDTRYQAFGFYLQTYYSEIYDYLIEYYGLPDLNKNDKNSYNDPLYLWSEFEKALADLDFESVLDNNTDLVAKPGAPNFKDRDWHSFSIEMETIVNDLTINLFKAFKQFILKIEYPKRIDGKIILLDKDASYLTFNYTDTLERYYEIPPENILYIHEKADHDENTLVLGHGIDPENFKLEEASPPEGLNDEEYENWKEEMADSFDYSYESGKQELMTYFVKSFKQTSEIISENESFFQKIENVTNIILLGHSLSEIDKPYLTEVFNSVTKNSIWSATYHENTDKYSHEEKLFDLGIKKDHIRLIKMDDLRKNI